MNTRIVGSEGLDEAVDLLKQGEVVAFPTETVYGLGADIFNPEAIQKIYQVKGRPSDNPLIAHVSSREQVDTIIENISAEVEKLMKAFWPGPLTIVLEKKTEVPNVASAGLSTIGVRMPRHPLALDLIKKLSHPIVAPSANLSGRPSPTTAQHVYDDLHGKISLILDGGPCEVGIESTVLDMSTNTPTILRPGFITQKHIEKVLGLPVLNSSQESNLPAKSPGMKYKHYSPNIPVITLENWQQLPPTQALTALLLSNKTPPTDLKFAQIEKLDSATLFSHFREAEKKQYTKIFIFLDTQTKQNQGLMNRLQRASIAPLS